MENDTKRIKKVVEKMEDDLIISRRILGRLRVGSEKHTFYKAHVLYLEDEIDKYKRTN